MKCIDGTLQFAVTAGVNYDALQTLILDKCDGTNNCVVDLTDWSTNGFGGQQFASMCDAVNGNFLATSSDGGRFYYNACGSFNVSYPGVHLCAPAECTFLFWDDDDLDVFNVMLDYAGFDCSDFAASSSPTTSPTPPPSSSSTTSRTPPPSSSSTPVVASVVAVVVILVGAGFSYH